MILLLISNTQGRVDDKSANLKILNVSLMFRVSSGNARHEK